MPVKRVFFVLVLLGTVASPAQTAPAPRSTGERRAEADKAQALFAQQNFVAAQPLYEDLHAAEPGNLFYEERLASCLVGTAKQQGPAEAAATRDRARNLLLAAQRAGDNSNLLQVLLENLGSRDPASVPRQPGQDLVDQGEKAFTRGDLPGALDAYRKALAVNPKLYAAALFAGDAEYKQNHFAEAGTWFAQAIAIDPNIETAYRYWGDALDKAGNHQHAEDEFIAAIVAQPYLRASRVGLGQWATRNHAQILPPPITLPAEASVTSGSNGKELNVTLGAANVGASDPETKLNVAYTMNTALWHGDKFHKTFPNEPSYRHSLAEVVDSVQAMLAVAREQQIPDAALSPSVKLLRELDAKGMLPCWVLLDHADAGIAQDYAAFRDAHRPLLAQYLATYDVHRL